MKIAGRLRDRRILIWGYGREGKSTERFINTHCSVKSLEVFEGAAEEIDESKYDYIIKSPGINVRRWSDKYISQTELFLEEFAAQTVGITGTKGKSTTSTLLHHVLARCLGEENAVLVGNIGLPCLDRYDDITENTVVVYEMSCHQLNRNRFSPHVAVFLNLYEDHLDYYGTKENYFATKKNITAHQTSNDYFFYGDNVPEIETAARKREIFFNEGETFSMLLRGPHNQFNARFVYAVATEVYGCAPEAVRAAIAVFPGLPHRMEYVGTVEGVAYYNDSISTIPEATIRAVNSFPAVKTVIIGGMDRGISYDILTSFIKAHPEYEYILAYESGKRIFGEVQGLKNCVWVPDLQAAVKLAREKTPAGRACMFSPAAASYGYFKDFEERGNYYKRLVLAGADEGGCR